MRLSWIWAALVVLVLFSSGGAIAADAAKLTGAVKTPLTLDEATLKSFPPVTVEIASSASAEDGKASYTGVLVWDLLKQAGLVNDKGTNAWLKHTLLVTADNGYAVALAAAELDPSYGNKQVLLAYAGNQAGFDHLRLVVPGDLRGGRSVRGLVTIEVK